MRRGEGRRDEGRGREGRREGGEGRGEENKGMRGWRRESRGGGKEWEESRRNNPDPVCCQEALQLLRTSSSPSPSKHVHYPLSTHGELFTVDHFLSLGTVEHFCLLQELALKHSLIHLSTTHHTQDLTICSVCMYVHTYIRASSQVQYRSHTQPAPQAKG